jgi:hypothetical protein
VTGGSEDLEVRFRWVTAAPVVLFGAALAAGLVLYLISPSSRIAMAALNAGLVLLIVSPAARMAVAIAERIRRADWTFVTMTALIALELLVVLWRAAKKG